MLRGRNGPGFGGLGQSLLSFFYVDGLDELGGVSPQGRVDIIKGLPNEKPFGRPLHRRSRLAPDGKEGRILTGIAARSWADKYRVVPVRANVAFTMTDKLVSIELFDLDGSYDP